MRVPIVAIWLTRIMVLGQQNELEALLRERKCEILR